MNRTHGRGFNRLRQTSITRHCQHHPPGSALIEVGNTRVICSATIEDRVPPFLKGTGQGWLTAEYSMLPSAPRERVSRERNKLSGRTQEIQRLIGRALRSVVNLNAFGERTITIDCDVIQADGGTRCASITGAFVALVEACDTIYKEGGAFPVTDFVAAVSVGLNAEGEPLLDLDYDEDSNAVVDCNVVMSGRGQFIEIQSTGEGHPFSRRDFDTMLDLATAGIDELISIQKDALGSQLVWRVGRIG